MPHALEKLFWIAKTKTKEGVSLIVYYYANGKLPQLDIDRIIITK